MKNLLSTLFAVLLVGPAAAQVGPSGAAQDPSQGSVGGGDPTTQSPVKPREGPGYSGPGDTVPPTPPKPVDPPVGGDAPGASDTPPGGTAPPPFVPPPSDVTPPGFTPPPTLGPIDPSTTTNVLGIDMTLWTWWWQLNREPYLVRKGLHSKVDYPVTGDDFLGRGTTNELPNDRPDDTVVFGKIAPSLLRTLSTERADDLLAASAMALARIGAGRAPEKKQPYSEVLRRLLTDGDPALLEAATLSLGVLGDEGSVLLLSDLVLATQGGRDALGGRRVSVRVRAFAAYALGLIGHRSRNEDIRRYIVHQLVWALETDDSESADLAAACINALGLVPIEDGGVVAKADNGRRDAPAPPGSSLSAQVDYLIGLLGERSRDRRVRGQVPIALGRLVQRCEGPSKEALRVRVIEELLDRIAGYRREPIEVMQSCVIALGQLGDNDSDELDRRVRRTLVRMEDTTNDLPTRQFALIALGRAAGRNGVGAPDLMREERSYLLHELSRGGTTMRSWAAIALGLWERGAGDDRDTRQSLRLALDDARVGVEIGAYAIGTGLARDRDGTPVLLEKLDDREDETTEAYLALALGLNDAPSAEAPLLALLPEARLQPTLLREAALALALLESPQAVPRLVDLLDKARSLASQSSIAQGLARSGDARAVDALLKVLEDRDMTGSARAYAASALGWIADADPMPWTALYSVDANLHAAPETLFDPDGTGLLNLF